MSSLGVAKMAKNDVLVYESGLERGGGGGGGGGGGCREILQLFLFLLITGEIL